MVGITKLFYGRVEPSDSLRYGWEPGSLPSHPPRAGRDRKPIVVWNITRRCNLKCIHCYSDSENMDYPGELDTREAFEVIDDLAGFQIPALLFSGGEPLLRRDIFQLMERAKGRGLRVVLSSNGTMISKGVAEGLKEVGLDYAGISLDGAGYVNDMFRGVEGAFRRALQGIRNLREAGVRTGIRFTMTRRNIGELDPIFDFVEGERIDRLCFYHLVFTGRGRGLMEEILPPEATRRAIDRIIERSGELLMKGSPIQVLTVDNHADGVYIYRKLERSDPARARKVVELLRWNGGNSSGVAIACLDNEGTIHPDQFWLHESVGSVRESPFSRIWTGNHPVLQALRDRKGLLKGRCSRCRFLDICNGNFRARAFHAGGDIWGEDPACYLTEEEITTLPCISRR